MEGRGLETSCTRRDIMTGIHRGAVLHVLGTHGPRGRLLPVSSVVPTVPPAPRGPFPAQSPALPCPALPCTLYSRSPHPRPPLFLEPFLLGSPSHPEGALAPSLEMVHIPIIPQPPPLPSASFKKAAGPRVLPALPAEPPKLVQWHWGGGSGVEGAARKAWPGWLS